MAVKLDLADIQGNILTAYGKLGFPKGRFILLHVDDAAGGRRFATAMLPMITTALRWPSHRSRIPTGHVVAPRPLVAVNIAFSWSGLEALGVPSATLRGMPDEFIDGMMARAPILGDDFEGRDPGQSWDDVWTRARDDRAAEFERDPYPCHLKCADECRRQRDDSARRADGGDRSLMRIHRRRARASRSQSSRQGAGAIPGSVRDHPRSRRSGHGLADRTFRFRRRHRRPGVRRAISRRI